MNAYTFIVNLKNYASNALNQIATSVGQAVNQARSLNSSLGQVQTTSQSLSQTLNKLKSVVASVFAFSAVMGFTNKVIEARSEYEKFNAVLVNTFQSEAVGAGALNMLNDFAAKTPFALNELTGSFVKLVNRGVLPTQDELTKLGDLASSQGKGFDQLTEALLDAQTGEFERLKEFGIKASKNGDMVALSFKGVTTEVKNNSDAITEALMKYGEMKGVAGSMEAISKTLGGKISNLEDQWNTFLVQVGGESGAIFTGVLTIMSVGLQFLSDNLGYVSEWFTILFEMIEPVIIALSKFLEVAFGAVKAGNAMAVFGNIMVSVLLVVNWLTTGLTGVINVLSPFAREILVLTAAWWLWNNAIGIFNALMLVSPVTWIVLGVIALITVIGMVMKYTSGWGESWKHTVTGAKLIWQTYTDYVRLNFLTMIGALMIGIDKIKLGWYKFKEAVGMGDSGENQKMIAQLNSDVESRKKAISDGYKKMLDSASKAKNEFSQVGIKVDTKGIARDFQGIKDRFNGVGKNQGDTSAYDDYLKKNKGLASAGGAGKGQDTKKPDSIVSGGSKITHITINIQKLQEDTKIYVENTEKGIERMGEQVQEMLLRAVNSVNQMQTG